MTEHTYVVKKDLSSYPLWKGEGLPRLSSTSSLRNAATTPASTAASICPPVTSNARSRELDTEAWKNILRQAADLGIMTVRFTGGEPLLRHDFPELYLFARRLGLTVLLFTNARLITPQIADLLADIPPLEDIEISVYGMKKESYEAVTGVTGSYAEFRNGMQSLLDRKIPFVVKGALLPPNKKETGEFNAWAATIPRMEILLPSIPCSLNCGGGGIPRPKTA